MTKSPMNILLIESTSSHFEWIYTQNEFLKNSPYHLDIAVDVRFAVRLDFLSEKQIKKFNFDNSNLLKYFLYLLKVRSLIRENHYQLVIFNTAHNNFIRDLLFVLPANLKKIGLLHRAQNLINSSTQKYITRKIDGYLTLADYQDYHVRKVINKPTQTIYNTQLINQKEAIQNIESKNHFRVVIPGAVENFRRDYNGFLNKLDNSVIKENFEFILLGKLDLKKADAYRINENIIKNSKAGQIKFFTQFVSDEEFDEVMNSANLLLPLIHPEMKNFENYLKYQISGTFNLSYSYKKPMLIHEAFSIYQEFKESCFFYNSENLFDKLTELCENPALLSESNKAIRENKCYTFQNQKTNYINFIKSVLKQQ